MSSEEGAGTEALVEGAAARRSGLLLFVALSVANAGNYLFQVVSSRFLGPADYSLMGGIFAVITVVGVSTSSLQTSAAKMVASSPPRIPVAVQEDPLVRRILQFAGPFTLLGILVSPLLALFLHSGVLPALLLAFYLLGAPLLSIGFGRLQGLQAFVAFAAISLGLAGGRLLVTTAALWVGFGVSGVVASSLIVTFIGAWASLQLSRRAAALPTAAMWKDTGRATAALVLFWVMVSADVPVARHVLDPELAGQYTAASVIGKAVLWLPGAISLVMFPKVTQARESGEVTHPHLVRSLALTLSLCCLAVVGMWVLGPALIPVIFGEVYGVGANLAWQVGLVCVPFAVANLLIFYHLTRASSGFILALFVGLVLEIGAFVAFHSSATAIIISMSVGSAAVVAGLVVPGTVRRARDLAGWSVR